MHWKENSLNCCQLTCSHASITWVALKAHLDAQSLRTTSETQVKLECSACQLAAVEQVFLSVMGLTGKCWWYNDMAQPCIWDSTHIWVLLPCINAKPGGYRGDSSAVDAHTAAIMYVDSSLCCLHKQQHSNVCVVNGHETYIPSIATCMLNTLSRLNYSYIWDKLSFIKTKIDFAFTEADVPFFIPW
jgi:hypothetical protein